MQRLAPRNHLKLKGHVLALDSTTIALCLELSPWAKFHHGKGAMKLHMAVDIAGDLPTVMVMTPGKVSDVWAAKGISFAPGTLLIMDRGYVDFKWMYLLLMLVKFQSRLSWGMPVLIAALTVMLFSNVDLKGLWEDAPKERIAKSGLWQLSLF